MTLAQAIDRFAPVLMQETEDPRLDAPCALDADGTDRLDDDHLAVALSQRSPVVWYAEGSEDRASFFLVYLIYYAADYSMREGARRIDHLGDLEGALVIVDRTRGEVDAVITEAHGRFYLFESAREGATLSGGASGSFGVTPQGRPILFAEAGGHGLYAFGQGRWTPRGGTRYPHGTAAVESRRLVCFAPGGDEPPSIGAACRLEPSVEVHPLREIDRFTLATGWLRDLPRAARHPRFWCGHRLGEAWDSGALLLWPRRLWGRLAAGPRP